MNIIGNLDPFADIFSPSLLPWVFRTILKEWNNFHRTTRTPLENRITKPFVGHLQSCQESRHLPFFFDVNVKLVNPGNDTETGELDIRVMQGKRPKVFFAFECKRLNVIRNGKYASQAGEYVGKEGMGCFLSGKYDGGGNCGGMMGYVMDNDVRKAIAAVNRALKTSKDSLGIKPPAELKTSSLVREKEYTCYETLHLMSKDEFTIYHLMLPYDGKA